MKKLSFLLLLAFCGQSQAMLRTAALRLRTALPAAKSFARLGATTVVQTTSRKQKTMFPLAGYTTSKTPANGREMFSELFKVIDKMKEYENLLEKTAIIFHESGDKITELGPKIENGGPFSPKDLRLIRDIGSGELQETLKEQVSTLLHSFPCPEIEEKVAEFHENIDIIDTLKTIEPFSYFSKK